MYAQIAEKAPSLSVAEWVQGETVNFDALSGRVVLVEVFQVNCPGCFFYALPQAIALHRQYADQGLAVLGLATAFEDFDKNTLENLKKLVESGEVVGETLKALKHRGALKEGRLPYKIPFPLGMDKLVSAEKPTEVGVEQFIEANVPDFDSQSSNRQQQIRQSVTDYLQKLAYHPQTFERFRLQGTPSQILVDKRGILKSIEFGQSPYLETRIQSLLKE